MKIGKRLEIVIVSLAAILASITWNWYAGKDLNWDQFNYHFYLPYSFLDDRLSKDFFAASVQSYLNPISYLPFYWMVTTNWHSLAIGSVLAGLHSLNLIFLYLLCDRLIPKDQNRVFKFKYLAFLLGALSPVFWVEVGSSFNDTHVSALTLAAIYASLWNKSTRLDLLGSAQVALSGLLLGMAVGLKLTAAVYAVAGVMLFASSNISLFSRQLLTYTVAGFTGYLITGGYWAYLLYREFGNPIFPFYNKIFNSPLFSLDNLAMMRFIPSSPWDVFTLPFEMMEPVSWVYTETISPDLRFAVLVMLVGLLALNRLLAKSTFAGKIFPFISFRLRANNPSQRRFGRFFVISIALWLITSANGRYGIPIALLVGIPIANIARNIFSQRHAILLLSALSIAQAGHIFYTADSRWSPSKWTPTWFEIDLPDYLVEKPHLFLSVGLQTNAFIAPFAHPDSSFVNIIGQSSISMESPAGERLRHLLEKFNGRTLAVVSWYNVTASRKENSSERIQNLSFSLSRFGLQLNPDRCKTLSARSESNSEYVNPSLSAEDRHYHVMICETLPVVSYPSISDGRSYAKKILNNVASACPDLFRPKLPEVEETTGGYYQHYVGTEYYLAIKRDSQMVFASQVRSSAELNFGKASDWEKGPIEGFHCPARRRSSPWFKATP